MKWLLFTFIFLFNSFVFSQTSIIRHAYLTWKDYTSESITVNIHTLETDCVDLFVFEGETQVFHSKSKGKPFLKRVSPRYLHHIPVHNLKPETIYDILIESPTYSVTRKLKFKTLPKKSVGLRLAFGGDWEKSEGGEKIAKVIADRHPHALVLGGDYPRFVDSIKDYKKWDNWLDMIETHIIRADGCSIPMILAIGNHDVFGQYDQPRINAPFFNNYFKQSSFKRNYFAKTLGDDLVLFILDSGHTAHHGGEQAKWLENMLERHQDRKIKIAVYHVPIYPSVRFSKKTLLFKTADLFFQLTGDSWKSEKLLSKQTMAGKKYWAPLFDKYSLTSAFEHHEHCLKRSKPIKNDQIAKNGTVYLGDGALGPHDQHTPIQNYIKDYFAKTIGYIHFFWLVEIREDHIRYRAVGSHGRTVDEYIQPLLGEKL